MSLTPSKMVPLGTEAPDFILPDTVSGQQMSLNQLKSEFATVIMFICNHCPYVKHVREELVRITNDYTKRAVSFIGISSNDIKEYPEDSPGKMKEEAIKYGYSFPYLFDETQEVARDYGAACTPDFYLFDKRMKLVYRGQLDGSRPGNETPLTGTDLRNAIDAVLSGNPVSDLQIPSVGCNIKWKD
ncbi:MAG TPA: thioredoxin family protein [Cyclobacteriaceae bacterium]